MAIQLYTYGDKGTWAVVTGASDGLGKEFAVQLAAKGFNIILVSRTKSKLETLAAEIEGKHGTAKTAILAMDFAQDKDTDYEALKALIQDKDISILVNNVGLSHDIPVPFAQTSESEMKNIIAVNCTATLRVTKTVLPSLMQKRRGLIITMASFAGLTPTPLLATYSGSKAFLQNWSTALGSELKPYNIKVQLVQSYLVASAMSKIKRTSATIPSPRNYVKAVLGSIGRSGGAQGLAHTSTPFWSHALMHWALATFLGTSNALVVDQNKQMHEGIRARALRKAEREGKKIS